MEIGAVKQAFNNELILLKKKLAQAKTQIIHKLTRKAKQLTEKKAPDALQEKFKKKAENAVKEVLILKKIKARDIGKFIVTHKGKLQDFLNKPQVDNDRACARLLLHKSMQEKYKSIRNRFSNIPIKDLFMSRNERLKLKKEEKLKQKEKRDRKKSKNKVVNAEGDWDVEDVGAIKNKRAKIDTIGDEGISGEEQDMSDEEDLEANSEQLDSVQQNMSDDNEQEEISSEQSEPASDNERSADESLVDDGFDKGFKSNFKEQSNEGSESGCSSNEMEASDDQQDEAKPANLVKLAPSNNTKSKNKANIKEFANKKETKSVNKAGILGKSETIMKNTENKMKLVENTSKVKPDKKQKDNVKNKNLQNKILNKKFKKDSDDTHEVENKVVDPFFVTATGENYMSIVEPRQPDEVKEEHKQGNRKLRRAVMFGHVPKIKPRQNRQEDNRFHQQNGFNKRSGYNLDQQNSFPQRNNKFNNKDDNRFSNKFDGSTKTRFNDRNDKMQEDSIPEKLHPSWEAKKKQSGILPFQGKKIVFD